MNRKHIFSVLAFATAMGSAIPASAYTLDEVFGPDEITVLETLYRSRIYDSMDEVWPIVSEVTFSRIEGDDQNIMVNNFAGLYNFQMFLSDKFGRPTTDGEYLAIHYKTAATNNANYEIRPTYWTLYSGYQSGSAPGFYTENQSVDYTFFKIEKDDLGLFKIESTTPLGLSDSTQSKFRDTELFHKASYLIAEPCAEGQHTRYSWRPNIYGGEPIRSLKGSVYFPTYVNIDKNSGRVRIYNLSNIGFALDSDYNTSYLEGTIDFSTGTGEFDEQQTAVQDLIRYVPTSSWGYGPWQTFNAQYYLARIDVNTSRPSQTWMYDDLHFTYTPDGVNHNSVEHGWVTNGGKRRTYEGMSLEIEPYTYEAPTQVSGNLPLFSDYQDAKILGGADVTVDVDLDLQMVGLSATHIAVGGEIKTNKNHQYVDHYEIHIVPGHYKSINDAGFIHHAENGHANGKSVHNYNLDEHVYVINPSSRASVATDVRSNDYSFKKMIPFDDLGEGFNEDNKEYTAYIKTVYKPITEEDGSVKTLTPTFHSMQYIEKDQITAVDEISADFNDANAPEEYYNLQGMRVEEPQSGNVYIVKKGSKVSKIRF